MLSSVIAFLGMLPAWFSRSLVKKLVGKFWSPAAVDALCTHLLQVRTFSGFNSINVPTNKIASAGWICCQSVDNSFLSTTLLCVFWC